MSPLHVKIKFILTFVITVFIILSSSLFSQDVKILMAGDLLLSGHLEQYIEKQGMDYPFKQLDSLLKRVHYLIFNLENPIVDEYLEPAPCEEKKYLFGITEKIAGSLLLTPDVIVNLANNHILDYGCDGLEMTIGWCLSHGISYYGAGPTLATAEEALIIEKDSLKIGILGYNMTYPECFWASDSSCGTAYPYPAYFPRNIRELRSRVDFIIVTFHWGKEKSPYPSKYQQRFAHLAIKNGADLVVGHHPHVIQTVETYLDKPIFYSLGNFVFSSYSDTARKALLLQTNLKKTREELQVDYLLYLLNVDNHRIHFQPEILKLFELEEYIRLSNITGIQEMLLQAKGPLKEQEHR